MQKSPAVLFWSRKVKITGREQMYSILNNAPLTPREYSFCCDMMEGVSLGKLAEKYEISYSRVTKWKRELCDRLLIYFKNQYENV